MLACADPQPARRTRAKALIIRRGCLFGSYQIAVISAPWKRGNRLEPGDNKYIGRATALKTAHEASALDRRLIS
jgi:hypothetical protein